MNATLRSLLAGFCDYVQAADREQIISTGNLLFDGVAFTVKSREQGQRREMLIYCDFGEAAPEEGDETCRRLLEANLLMYNGSSACVFSLTPDTGRVVLLSHLDMKGLSAGRLAANLGMLAACALAWRDGSLDFNNPWRMGLPEAAVLRDRA